MKTCSPVGFSFVGGRYRVVARGGRGGFGTVYMAIDARTRRVVAIKVLDRRHVSRLRFEQEVEILAALRHPNVVSYVDHGWTTEGAPYLVMDWLEGIDLSQKLAGGPLDLEDALVLGARAAKGLASAHRAGVCHRDVKPGNVFLVGGSVADVRVIDFGVAARAEERDQTNELGPILGTPAYMAPEQARGMRSLTPRVDVFALGCVLYECLTGAPAFTGVAPQAVLAQIVSAAPPRVSSRRPDVPRAVDDLVAKMMAYDATDRFADAETTAMAIADVLATCRRAPLVSSRGYGAAVA